MIPHHLAGWASAALALVLAACHTPSRDPRPANHASTPTTAPSVANRSASTPREHGTDGHSIAEAPPRTHAVAVAEQFARAFIGLSPDAQSWFNALAPMCEPGFTATLAQADFANLPARSITGAAHLVVSEVDTAWIAVEIPTDAGTLILTVAPVDGQWLVSGIDFRRGT